MESRIAGHSRKRGEVRVKERELGRSEAGVVRGSAGRGRVEGLGWECGEREWGASVVGDWGEGRERGVERRVRGQQGREGGVRGLRAGVLCADRASGGGAGGRGVRGEGGTGKWGEEGGL